MWALIDLDILKIVLAPLKVLRVTACIHTRHQTKPNRKKTHTHKNGETVCAEWGKKWHKRPIIWRDREKNSAAQYWKPHFIVSWAVQYARQRHMLHSVCSISTNHFQSNNSFPWNGAENLNKPNQTNQNQKRSKRKRRKKEWQIEKYW